MPNVHGFESDRSAWKLEDLLGWELPDTHLVNEAKGSLLLNLPRMNRDFGNLEARKHLAELGH